MSEIQSSNQATGLSSSQSHGRDSYPSYLLHANRLFGLLALLSLMVGGTILIIQIWENDNHQWIWQLCGNLAALIAFCLLSMGINHLLGRSTSTLARLSHFFLIFCLVACLVVVSLVIWDQTDVDIAWKAIGTIMVIVVVSCIGIAISKSSDSSHRLDSA